MRGDEIMKANRIISVILAAALILTLYSALFAQHVSAQETPVTEPEKNFTVKSYGGDDDPYCYITGYSGNSADLVITDTIGGKKLLRFQMMCLKKITLLRAFLYHLRFTLWGTTLLKDAILLRPSLGERLKTMIITAYQ